MAPELWYDFHEYGCISEMSENMPNVILIDDDLATEVIVETLGYRGFDAYRISSAAAALESIDDVAAADLVVLDIIMKRPEGAEKPNVSGDRVTGMLILKTLRERNPDIPVLVYSGTRDPDLIDAISSTPHTEFLSKWNTPSPRDFIDVVERLILLCEMITHRYPNLDLFCLSVVSDRDIIRRIQSLGVKFLRKGETPLRTVLNMMRSRLTGVAYSTERPRDGGSQ